jgi:plasmid stabilization system protein ParE
LVGNRFRRTDGIRAYISVFDLAAADRMIERLPHVGNSLSDFPHRGRPAGNGLREIATVRPYILRYRVDADTVSIVRIRHGARQPD